MLHERKKKLNPFCKSSDDDIEKLISNVAAGSIKKSIIFAVDSMRGL